VSSAWHLLNVGAEGALRADALVTAAKEHHEHHENNNVVELRSRSHHGAPPGGSRVAHAFSSREWWTALAASLALGALWVTYQNWQSPMILQTAVGKQSSVTLQDGSVVSLNTNSKVSVVWSRTARHIDLVRGEARFEVARDASRPFTVATATATVRALGTVFNVRAEPLAAQVAVLEGQVEVTLAAASEPAADAPATTSEGPGSLQSPTIERVRLGAGERASVTRAGIQTNAGPSIEAVAAWTQQRLVFRDQPLAAVIREFNRYRTHPLVLDDGALAEMKISGVFDANDPDSLIKYLGIYETVQVDHRGDGSQRLFRGSVGVDSKQ
jgi:transmembrane sensor